MYLADQLYKKLKKVSEIFINTIANIRILN